MNVLCVCVCVILLANRWIDENRIEEKVIGTIKDLRMNENGDKGSSTHKNDLFRIQCLNMKQFLLSCEKQIKKL